MKRLSRSLLTSTVITARKSLQLSQQELAAKVHMHRSMIGRIEKGDYLPTIEQLEMLGQVLGFEPVSLFTEEKTDLPAKQKIPSCKIAVAGTGYVGLSLAVLLSQHNHVTAVDILPEKVEKLNHYISPIQDTYIEKYLSEAAAGTRKLDLHATTDGKSAYADADYVIVAAPTNYDPKTNFFDCSAVESVIRLVLEAAGSKEKKPMIVIKSTVPVGYTEHVRKIFGTDDILFSPEFLRESKALYDNLYPSRIIVGCDEKTKKAAYTFASLLQQGP